MSYYQIWTPKLLNNNYYKIIFLCYSLVEYNGFYVSVKKEDGGSREGGQRLYKSREIHVANGQNKVSWKK